VIITLIVASFALSRVVKLNLTASMPIGLYALHQTTAIRRGTIVVACPPPTAQRLGLLKGYLAPARGLLPQSRCAAGSAPLLKYAIAFGGDEIRIDSRGIALNGHLFDSRAVAQIDRSGRALATVPNGIYRIRHDEMWLYSPSRYSWDSRYFGPVKVRDILGTAKPIWTTRALLTFEFPSGS
jgi:conjugative transfer signal peptidase TraF